MYGGYSRGAGMSGITSQPLTIAAFGNLFNSLCFSFLIYKIRMEEGGGLETVSQGPSCSEGM